MGAGTSMRRAPHMSDESRTVLRDARESLACESPTHCSVLTSDGARALRVRKNREGKVEGKGCARSVESVARAVPLPSVRCLMLVCCKSKRGVAHVHKS